MVNEWGGTMTPEQEAWLHIKDKVYFDPIIGGFRYNDHSPHQNMVRHERVGTLNARGYRFFKCGKINTYEHRVVWTLYNGPIPEGYTIDHLDVTKPKDYNCPTNLSCVTNEVNIALGCIRRHQLKRKALPPRISFNKQRMRYDACYFRVKRSLPAQQQRFQHHIRRSFNNLEEALVYLIDNAKEHARDDDEILIEYWEECLRNI